MLVRAVLKRREGQRAPGVYSSPTRDYKRACEQSQVKSCEYSDEYCDVRKLESIAYLIPLEMNNEQLSARPDRLLLSEGAVDGLSWTKRGRKGLRAWLTARKAQCILASEEGTRVHTYNLKQRTAEAVVSGGIHS